MNIKQVCLTVLCIATLGLTGPTFAEDWPMWGRTVERNMYSPEEGLPSNFEPGDVDEDGDEIDMDTTENVKWVARMGSQTYGNPTVADGRVYVGTNNDGRDDDRFEGDHSILRCLDEETGEVLWTLTVPKLGAGKVSDWEYLGICSSATVDGDRAYIVTTRNEVICLDVNGMEDGNQGMSEEEEARYMAGPDAEPVEVKDTDADILWVYDMREELGVFPHNTTSTSPLVIDGKVYSATSNGVDWSHTNTPNPRAPALICLDGETGELIGEEASNISQRLLHANWSSPTYGEVDGQEMIIFGAGDGWCYALDPEPKEDEDGFGILEEIWRFDATAQYREDEDGEEIKYPRYEGPSEIIATPVFHDEKVYVAIGQDPEHGEGVGNLVAIDAGGSGDITSSGEVWNSEEVKRSISTASIADGLLFVADYSGFIHCFDAKTGEKYWEHDSFSHIWGSTLAADGKVYIGNENGDLIVLPADKEADDGEPEPINTIAMYDPVYSSPIVANGVLYVATASQLYAIEAED